MARYTCACGHHWSDTTSRFDGYICWTHGEVEAEVARRLWAFAQACQAGRDCGSCVSQIRDMIRPHLAEALPQRG